MDKKQAREYGLRRRAALSPQIREEKNRILYEKALALCQPYSVIGCYVSMKTEADTVRLIRTLLEQKKTVCVPKVTGRTLVFHRIASVDDLAEGTFGVREPVREDPVALSEIGMMLVPLSAYDSEGNRTGYGRGYYDSVLAECPRTAGIAYREQMVEKISSDPWDIPLDTVISA